MKKTQPIGIFDSGVGGISVMSHIQSFLPNESLAYVADSLYAPYGMKSNDVILERSKTSVLQISLIASLVNGSFNSQ